MTRTLSASARAEKQKEIREKFPALEERLDAFRDNDLSPQAIIAIIRHERMGDELKGALSEKFAGMEDTQKQRVVDAANDLVEGYSEFFESRRRHGVAVKAPDAFTALEGDIGKICNFTNASPYHKARQGIENHLNERAQELDSPDAQQAPLTEATETAQHKRGDAQKLAMVAGTAAGVGAAVEATKHWRERVKKPESRKKAMAFAGAAVVSLGAVGAAIMMGRSGFKGFAGLAASQTNSGIAR